LAGSRVTTTSTVCYGGESRRSPIPRRRPASVEDTYRQVKGRLDLKVSDLGAVQLKNIPEPVRVNSLEVGQPTQAKPPPSMTWGNAAMLGASGAAGALRRPPDIWPRAHRDYPIVHRLKAVTGRCSPLRTRSPAGSRVAPSSIAARTLLSTKICPSLASAQSRAARLTTVPIAA
jgi:hypothetical protein